MSTTCGFFNSMNKDRMYNATHFGHCFDGIILDGILAAIGDCFVVKAAGGMNITVGSGKAWYLASWLENDADLPMTHAVSDVVLSRIDAVVMEFDTTEFVRWNDVKIIQGTASSAPERPVLVNTKTKVQIPLAYVYVGANSSEVTQENITNMVGTSQCPFSTGLFDRLDIDNLIMQWTADFDRMFAELKNQIDQAASGTLIDGSVSVVYNTVLSVGQWVESESDFYQTVDIVGILESDKPIVDLNLSNIDNADIRLEVADAWTVYHVISNNGSMTFRSTNKPELDIPVQIRCIRK